MEFANNSILVVADVDPAGNVLSSAAGMLGAELSGWKPCRPRGDRPRRGGAAAAALGKWGAAQVLVAETAEAGSVLTRPVLDAHHLPRPWSAPTRRCSRNSVEGREVASRFAARTRSGLTVDVVEVDA